jgi:hypothetical protein
MILILGIGQTVVVGPIYLAEIAPAEIRGICTCFFTGFGYTGVVLAYFSNYGASLHLRGTEGQWVRLAVSVLNNTPGFRSKYSIP